MRAHEHTPYALVVEDYRPHALAAADILRQVGFQVEVASTFVKGVESIRAAHQRLPGEQRFVVVLDLHIPRPWDKDGSAEDATMTEGAAIAAYLSPEIRRRAVLVASTSDPAPETHEEAYVAGCNLVLLKPFQLEHGLMLLEMLAHPPESLLPAEPINVQQPDRIGVGALFRALQRAARTIVRHAFASDAAPWRWNEQAVRNLIYSYPDLVKKNPQASRWVEAHGGLDRVLEYIDRRIEIVIKDDTQRQILEYILSNPYSEDWEQMVVDLSMSKSSIYRRRSAIFCAIASDLNAWG